MGSTNHHLTAADRGYAPTNGRLNEGDVVRVKDMPGDRFRVLGFRDDHAELWTLPPQTGQRTLPADRLVLVKRAEVAA